MRATNTIRAGQMRSSVTFKKRPPDGDTTGYVATLTSATTLEELEGWETRYKTRGEFLYDRGLEGRESRQDISLAYATLYIRFNAASFPEVTDACICDGVIYGVAAAKDIDGHRKKVAVTLKQVE